MNYRIKTINDSKTLLILGEKAFLNAKELYFESKLLFLFRRYSRALFLAQIGGEEIGKHILCLTSYLDYRIGKFNLNDFVKRFYDHKEKTLLVGFLEDVLLDIEVKNAGTRLKEAKILENAKFMGLYTNILEEYIFKPSDICNAQIVNQAIVWLGNRIRLFGKMDIRMLATKMENKKDEEVYEFYQKFMNRYFDE